MPPISKWWSIFLEVDRRFGFFPQERVLLEKMSVYVCLRELENGCLPEGLSIGSRPRVAALRGRVFAFRSRERCVVAASRRPMTLRLFAVRARATARTPTPRHPYTLRSSTRDSFCARTGAASFARVYTGCRRPTSCRMQQKVDYVLMA